MLACYLTWHLRKAWAPLTFTDESPRPGQPGRPRPALSPGAGQGLLPARPGRPTLRSFRALLDHLATLTRNQVRFTGTRATIPMLTEPTTAQRQAFDLLGVPIPLTLK